MPHCLPTPPQLGRVLNAFAGVRRRGERHFRALCPCHPLKATNAHVSIVGHAPPEELRRSLKSTKQANDFGNRFLWLCVRRSKLLPDGGWLPPVGMDEAAVPIGARSTPRCRRRRTG